MKAAVPPVHGVESSDQACSQPDQAEVDQSGPALGIDQDVPGLDVLVDDPPGVEVGDGPRQLGHEPGGLARAGAILVDEPLQSQAGHVLHDDERPAFVDVEVDDPDQVGMIALGQGPPLEAQSGRARVCRPGSRSRPRSAAWPA